MDFTAVELRVGTVVAAEDGPGGLRLSVRFGPGDVRPTTARITERYAAADVLGRQVVAVMRPPGDEDGVIVLAALGAVDGAVLVVPDGPVPDGTPVV